VDDALVVRDELRSYALRRCIRFYTAILVFCIAWSVSYLPARGADQADVRLGGVFLLLVMTAVELGAMAVMAHMARARQRIGGGPETPLWAFAQGPWPSAIGAGFFLFLAALLWLWR
jgi:hypothetical protein